MYFKRKRHVKNASGQKIKHFVIALFISFPYLCLRKTKGCPTGNNTDGLRSYPVNLMRLVPPKGLLLPPPAIRSKKQLFVFTGKFINGYNMKLTVNSKETEVKDGCTVAGLAALLALPEKGIAIAANNRMVPRTEWENHVLQPGDSLVVIKAACGG